MSDKNEDSAKDVTPGPESTGTWRDESLHGPASQRLNDMSDPYRAKLEELQTQLEAMKYRLRRPPENSEFDAQITSYTASGLHYGWKQMWAGSAGIIAFASGLTALSTDVGAAIEQNGAAFVAVGTNVRMRSTGNITQRAFVFQGPSSAAGNGTGNAMEVVVKKDGGAQGSDVAFASWTYTIYNSSDSTYTTPLATGLALQNGSPSSRWAEGEVNYAVDGARGIAQKNGGAWTLLSVDEIRVVDVCDPALTIGSPANGLSASGTTLTLGTASSMAFGSTAIGGSLTTTGPATVSGTLQVGTASTTITGTSITVGTQGTLTSTGAFSVASTIVSGGNLTVTGGGTLTTAGAMALTSIVASGLITGGSLTGSNLASGLMPVASTAGLLINSAFKPTGLLFTHFADAGNGTTVETDLYSDTIAAAQLSVNGGILEGEYGGVFVSSATATRQIKLYFGGTAIFDTGALTLSLSSAWTLYASIIRASATVVRYIISLTTQGAALAAYTASGELAGLTLSNTNVLKITGQAAGVGAASNDIVAKMGYIGFKPF